MQIFGLYDLVNPDAFKYLKPSTQKAHYTSNATCTLMCKAINNMIYRTLRNWLQNPSIPNTITVSKPPTERMHRFACEKLPHAGPQHGAAIEVPGEGCSFKGPDGRGPWGLFKFT